MSEMNYPVQQGWQCPVCKRVYSPTTPMCGYCPGYSVTTTWEKPPEHIVAMGGGGGSWPHPATCKCTRCKPGGVSG